MNGFNLVDCFIKSTNTGFGKCVPAPGILMYDIMVPKGTAIALADAQPATFQAFLEAMTLNNDPFQRAYVLGKYIKVEDSTAAPQTETYDQGAESTIGDSAYIWRRRQKAGALCGHDALRKFNGKQDAFDGLLVFKSNDSSSKYYIMGTTYTDSTGVVFMAGVQYDDIWSPGWSIAKAAEQAAFWLKTTMGDPSQINDDNRIFVGVNFDPGALPRIQDVNVTGAKASTGIFDFDLTLLCSAKKVVTLYPDIADVSVVTVTNQLFNVVTVLTATIVGGKLRIALDTADADYTAGTTFTFTFAPVGTLAAAPFEIKYIEILQTVSLAK